MKRSLSAFVLIVSSLFVSAQSDTLHPTISYSISLGVVYANYFDIDVDQAYPADLKESNLFFIKVRKEDTYKNTGLYGPRYKKINAKIQSKMKSRYKYSFSVFESDYLGENRDYFVQHGYKYRLLVYSRWITIVDIDGFTRRAQEFALVVEDVENGTVYWNKEWWKRGNYIRKFIEAIEEG